MARTPLSKQYINVYADRAVISAIDAHAQQDGITRSRWILLALIKELQAHAPGTVWPIAKRNARRRSPLKPVSYNFPPPLGS